MPDRMKKKKKIKLNEIEKKLLMNITFYSRLSINE